MLKGSWEIHIIRTSIWFTQILVMMMQVTKHDVYNFHPLLEESSLYRELESQGRLIMLS
jgi:hypothetical protein